MIWINGYRFPSVTSLSGFRKEHDRQDLGTSWPLSSLHTPFSRAKHSICVIAILFNDPHFIVSILIVSIQFFGIIAIFNDSHFIGYVSLHLIDLPDDRLDRKPV